MLRFEVWSRRRYLFCHQVSHRSRQLSQLSFPEMKSFVCMLNFQWRLDVAVYTHQLSFCVFIELIKLSLECKNKNTNSQLNFTMYLCMVHTIYHADNIQYVICNHYRTVDGTNEQYSWTPLLLPQYRTAKFGNVKTVFLLNFMQQWCD